MSRHAGCQINGSRTLGAIESPHCLYGQRVQIHGFAAVAPTGRYGQGSTHVLCLKKGFTFIGFCPAANGFRGDDALHLCAVRIPQTGLDQLLCCICHVHGLLFQIFTDTELSAVNDRTDTDFRIYHKLNLTSTGFDISHKMTQEMLLHDKTASIPMRQCNAVLLPAFSKFPVPAFVSRHFRTR